MIEWASESRLADTAQRELPQCRTIEATGLDNSVSLVMLSLSIYMLVGSLSPAGFYDMAADLGSRVGSTLAYW